jgi:uncharacterized protein
VPAPLSRDDVALAVAEREAGATVALRVVPRAPRTEIAGRHGRALKLKVHAPPVDGAANEVIRRYLADRAGVRPSDVELLQGERSRDKVVLVRGVRADELVASLVAGG